MIRFAPLALLVLTACSPNLAAQVSKGPTTEVDPVSYIPTPGITVQDRLRGNAEMQRDFLDLAFNMETGQQLATLSRFEGPVTIGMTGAIPASAPHDLALLIARLQTEAAIDVSASAPGSPASITVEFTSRTALRALAPTAACFVVPNVSSLAEYRARRGTAEVNWAEVRIRIRAVVLVPAETSPQEIRDCLHEEIAQALGPLNDLYRLSDSVFNDDNFNTVLTRFDMLVLRAYYSPQLRSGMTRDQVAALLPVVFANLNPEGGGMGVAQPEPTPRAWTIAIETALGRQGSAQARLAAADRALALAKAAGWSDNRLAFSHFAVARLSVGTDKARALAEFSAAAAIYARQPGAEVHVAHIEMQLAVIALASGNPEDTLRLADHAIPVVQRHENAALLATLMLLKAEALEQLGNATAAAALRLDSQPWARYGFGSEAVVKARMRDIAAMGNQGARG